MAARALVWRRRLLPALCIVLPAFAQAADAAGDAERGQPPSIHGRTSPPEDVGKPPVLALSGGSDCGSRRADFEARSTFKSRKRVWNASRIASVGSSYRLEACEAASDAFDKAAELSAGPGNRAFESASQAAFQAASACRAAFDALCSAECSGVKDAECEAADAEKRELDFLDAQDSQFARAARQDSVQRQRLAGCREGSSESGVAQASARPATAAQAASQPAVVAPAKTAQAKAGDQAAAKAADAYDLAAINKEIDALPYDASVKSDLKLMAKYGDPADVRQTLATLKTYKPKIEFSPSDLWSCGGGSCGWSYAQTFGHQKIQVNPGYVLSKDGWQFPISSVKYKEVAAAEHYSSTAPLAVTDPNNKKRKDLGMVDGTHEYLYPDGSKLVMYSDASVAGTMMHEINHVKRDGEGGGTNGYSNELDAHDIQYRFYTRYEEKSSGKISLDLWKSSMLDEWQVDPKRFSDDLIDRYIANGEIKSTGETTIEQQKAAAQKRLDAAQKIAADPKASKKDRDAALQTVQAEKRELAGLAKDATLHVTEEQYQEQWRADVESSFRAWVASDAAKQRQQVQSAKMTKAARAKALADLQQRSQDELSIPWEYIPCWDGATMASGCPKP